MEKWFSLVLITLTTISLSFVGFSVPAYAGKTSVGLKVSTLGAGVEVERSFSEKFGGRVGLNYFSYSYDGTEEDIDYDFDLELLSGALLLDWHPFSGSFRLTGGLFSMATMWTPPDSLLIPMILVRTPIPEQN